MPFIAVRRLGTTVRLVVTLQGGVTTVFLIENAVREIVLEPPNRMI